jgi:RNA polymerase sigma factor (sigma-70 family)
VPLRPEGWPVPGFTTTVLEECFARWRAGDPAARGELIAHSCERLRRLTRSIVDRDYRRLRAVEQTDDVLNTALVRLMRALETAPPATLAEYFQLAGRQVRWVLGDLIRHHFGPHGDAARQQSLPPAAGSKPGWQIAAPAAAPDRAAMWQDFFDRIEALPAGERTVVDLLWFEKVTQKEAAELLGIPLITVRRRWATARLTLRKAFGDGWPVE